MTALLRRFDCGHTEFTGNHASSTSAFASVHLGVAGPCSQCIADGAKRLALLASEIGPMVLPTREDIDGMLEQIKRDPFDDD